MCYLHIKDLRHSPDLLERESMWVCIFAEEDEGEVTQVDKEKLFKM